MALAVSSGAFREGEALPARFTCQGRDVSPALRIAGVPPAARFLALVVDDPDAPGGLWTHWTAWDLPATLAEVPEAFRPATVGGIEGKTSAGTVGWHGPCPPPGAPHRYFFRVFALDARLGLPGGAGREALEAALKERVLAEGRLMGMFRR